MQADDLITIQHQTRFYQDRIKMLILLFVLLLGSIFTLSIFIMFQWIATPPPTYFALTERQQLFEEPPLFEPGMNTNALLNWVTESMMNIYSFNFMNGDQMTVSAKDYFTDSGYQGYIQVLKETGELEFVKNYRLVLSGMVSAAPIVEKQGVVKGAYMWQVTFPMTLTYDSVDFTRSRDIEVRVIVTRVSTQETPMGLRIFKFETPVNNNVSKQILQQTQLSPFNL